MKRLIRAAPWLALGLISLFFLMALHGRTKDVTDQTASIPRLTSLYEGIENLHPSSLSPELMEIVKRRTDCYGESPTSRLNGECNTRYLEDLIEVGRRNILSAPRIGYFLIDVKICPIMYSICMGERADLVCREIGGEMSCTNSPDNDVRCTAVEAKCIDGVLDEHWRGAPLSPISYSAVSSQKAGDSAEP
ncbi:MAG: hypothetical protein LBJ64_12710 [Deltaproteobacteria bacterium]|jgi:hypothetical protein|nr:hypothetical protein [Deltaproteobacteria bacterium]